MRRLLAFVLVLLVSPAALRGGDPTTLKAIGIIEQYDTATRTLRLATSSEVRQFTLEPTVRIRQGRRALDASHLAEFVGCRAAVRYLDGPHAQTVEIHSCVATAWRSWRS